MADRKRECVACHQLLKTAYEKCHNTRNLGKYEGMLDVDEGLVADLIAATQKVSDALGT